MSTARCRLTTENYNLVTQASAALGEAVREEGALTKLQPLLQDLAKLLWTANFCGEAQPRRDWLAGFRCSLPAALCQSWIEAVRLTSPADVRWDDQRACKDTSGGRLRQCSSPDSSQQASRLLESRTTAKPALPSSERKLADAIDLDERPKSRSSTVEIIDTSRRKFDRVEWSATPLLRECTPQTAAGRAESRSRSPHTERTRSADDSAGALTLQCVICRAPPEAPAVAVPCGHYACMICWRQWLHCRLECPICRKKVRPANLMLLRGFGQ